MNDTYVFFVQKFSDIAKNTKTQIDDIIIESTKGPFIIWFIMLGIYLGLEISKMPEEAVHIMGRFF